MPEYLKYIIYDILNDLNIKTRKMFGSYGLYNNGIFFGIYSNGEFYIKKGENKNNIFVNNGTNPLTYEKLGKKAYLKNYLKIKEEILEDKEKMKIIISKSNQLQVNKNDEILKQKVLNLLLKIPQGKITTYKIIADFFKIHPRKVAMIMKYNKDINKYPCYKVISHNGKISGYNSPFGVDDKIKKLTNDKIKIIDGQIGKEYYFYFN